MAYITDCKLTWIVTCYLVISIVAAVHLVRKHIPEYIAETREEVAQLDAQLKEYRTANEYELMQEIPYDQRGLRF